MWVLVIFSVLVLLSPAWMLDSGSLPEDIPTATHNSNLYTVSLDVHHLRTMKRVGKLPPMGGIAWLSEGKISSGSTAKTFILSDSTVTAQFSTAPLEVDCLSS